MINEACSRFFQATMDSKDLQQQWKAVTSLREIVWLGRRYGYEFAERDIIEASSTMQDTAKGVLLWGFGRQPATKANDAASRFYHHEFDISDIPGLAPVTAELENVKITPSTINMDRFHAGFRQADFDFAALSPGSPEFLRQHQEIERDDATPSVPGSGYGGREHHMINLDNYPDHSGYGAYFDAKCRIINALETFFGEEIRFSAGLLYPPKGYRTWHTNENQPGWRMYIIDFDGDPRDAGGESFFRYMNPHTKEIVTLTERPRIVRFFRIEQEKDKLFWHCIVNASKVNRWSFGFLIPDNCIGRLPVA